MLIQIIDSCKLYMLLYSLPFPLASVTEDEAIHDSLPPVGKVYTHHQVDAH